MNLTLSVDERTVEKARRAAQAMGKSLNQVIRDYLEQMAGDAQVDDDIAELRRLSMTGEGHSKGWRFNRDDLHDRS